MHEFHNIFVCQLVSLSFVFRAPPRTKSWRRHCMAAARADGDDDCDADDNDDAGENKSY